MSHRTLYSQTSDGSTSAYPDAILGFSVRLTSRSGFVLFISMRSSFRYVGIIYDFRVNVFGYLK